MTHSVRFLIMYNKLSKTCYISSQQTNSAIPYASVDAKMHPDRGSLATGALCHGTIGTMINPPLGIGVNLGRQLGSNPSSNFAARHVRLISPLNILVY